MRTSGSAREAEKPTIIVVEVLIAADYRKFAVDRVPTKTNVSGAAIYSNIPAYVFVTGRGSRDGAVGKTVVALVNHRSASRLCCRTGVQKP